ncbi:MAG: SPFH domain-containing protein, partial [Gemmatimonadales bacterium]
MHGGRTLRVPIIERVSRLDLTTLPIEVVVRNAYSKGGIPLIVHGIANVKISARDPVAHNAVERMLDKPFDEIMQIAKDTLEGNLRGVLATLTPEEVNEDRLKFAHRLIEEADEDMKKLGLDLDTLKVQNVTDEVNYLDSIGRQQTAEILKKARVAEAQRSSEAEQTEAAARRAAEIAKVEAELAIVEKTNQLRVRTAELEATALAKEKAAPVAGEKAKTVAEQELQQERIGLEQRRLEADVLLPARAEREAAEQLAKGVAASIVEDGKARVFVLEQMIKLYLGAGSEAERIFILNMLPEIIKDLAKTVEGIDIDRLTVIDSGEGTAVASTANQLPAAVIKLTEQIEAATGVNILSKL